MTATEAYISVDIETAGPIPAQYSMLSLGACVVGNPQQTFYAELRPMSAKSVPAALQVSGLSLERLAETGRDPQEAMHAFAEWVQQASGAKTPVFVAFNASFDWAFVNWYFQTYLGSNPFGIGGLDIKAYYMGFAGCSWQETRSSQLPVAFQPDSKATHHALDDSIAQAEVFSKLLAASQQHP
jgi:DNA polymerase III epsilon subunit-like protein